MSVKEKTLLVLTPGFPANEADTTCVPARQTFVKALKRNNPSLNVVVVAFQYPFFNARYLFFGVNVISLNGRNNGKFYKIITWLKAWKALKGIHKDNEVIGLLSFWLGECALVGNYFAKRYHLKHFTWLLGQDAKQGNIYNKLVHPHSHSLIALSDFIADEFYKNYHIRPKYFVPVGIDVTMFSATEVARDIDIMGAGSLIPLKRYDLFISIIQELVSNYPALKCVLCGQGPEKETLLQLIKNEGLQQNITSLNEVPHAEVLLQMQRSKIFLHTSSYEGYGTVCSEALYAGAHVINFCKPMKEAFEHEYFVKSKDEAIIKAKEILKTPDLDHKRVLAYSVDEVAKRIMDLFIE